MVKELGTFFEQFTKEYLQTVENFEMVETNRKFQITRKDYKVVEGTERQAHWSDIDVLGTKGNEVHLISCKELIDTQKVVDKIKSNLVFAERAMKREFQNKDIVKRVACISKHRDYMVSDVTFLYFRDMVQLLLRNIQRRASHSAHSIGYVKYSSEWFVRALDVAGLFSSREQAYETYKFPPKTHVMSASEFVIRPIQ
jgi:hypothetical protein